MSKSRTGTIRSVAALVAFTVGMAACGSDDDADTASDATDPGSSVVVTEEPAGEPAEEPAVTETIKIGAIHPLTGPLALDGVQMDNAAKLAVERINAAGGIESLGGAQLELMSGDSEGAPDVGQAEAQRLIEDGAVALIGTFQSAVAINIANLAERSEIPFVIDVGVDDDLIKEDSRFAFRIGPNASAFGRISAQYLQVMADSAGVPVKRVAYMHEQTAFGAGVYAGFAAEAENLGMTIVEEISYDAFGSTSLTTELARVDASDADVLATTGYYPDGVLIARDAAVVAPDVSVFYGVSHGAYAQSSFATDAGDGAELAFATDHYWDTNNPRVTEIRDAFAEAYGDEMRSSAVLAYQTIEVIADALERAGSSERRALRDALSETSLSDILLAFEGPIQFDETGENTNATPAVLQVQGGAAVVVYPEQFATAKPVIPGVGWDPG